MRGGTMVIKHHLHTLSVPLCRNRGSKARARKFIELKNEVLAFRVATIHPNKEPVHYQWFTITSHANK